MTALYLYDDDAAREFEPFALTRPLGEMRAGAELIRKRWESATDSVTAGFIAASHLAGFVESDAPPAVPPDFVIPIGSIIANTRFVPAMDAQFAGSAAVCNETCCAVRTTSAIPVSHLADGNLSLAEIAGSSPMESVRGRWLNAPWNLISTLSDQLNEDIPLLSQRIKLETMRGEVVGNGNVFLEAGARIDPFVVFETGAGPILIRAGASVAPFSRLVGPLYIGENVSVMGDSISTCSIGEWSKVRGEMSNTIMLGHSNKGHTGFVGHSYLGRWVNLGSGTTTSNLKNTYGRVQIWSPKGIVDSGMQFLGTLFGDHAKTGIGMMLTTGSVIGAGANIFGSTMPPKAVAPFSWGDSEPYSTFEEEKFLLVAERMMSRRHVELDAKARQHLKTCYARRWTS